MTRPAGDKTDYCAKSITPGGPGVDQLVWLLVYESAGFCEGAPAAVGTVGVAAFCSCGCSCPFRVLVAVLGFVHCNGVLSILS